MTNANKRKGEKVPKITEKAMINKNKQIETLKGQIVSTRQERNEARAEARKLSSEVKRLKAKGKK